VQARMLMVSHPADPCRPSVTRARLPPRSFSQAVVGVALVARLFEPTPESVKVDVHIDQPSIHSRQSGIISGYDKPTTLTPPNGRKHGRVGRLGPVPAYVRAHNLLTTADGSASLKWDRLTLHEDAAGNSDLLPGDPRPHFPMLFGRPGSTLVEIGFMPEACRPTRALPP